MGVEGLIKEPERCPDAANMLLLPASEVACFAA